VYPRLEREHCQDCQCYQANALVAQGCPGQNGQTQKRGQRYR